MKKTAQIKLSLFQRPTTLLLALLCMITVSPAFAADDYLDALSDEATSSAQVHNGESHDEAYYENQKKMVEALRLEKPSTYKFYTKLTPKNKTRVYEKYSADNADANERFSHLQTHIMNLYFKK